MNKKPTRHKCGVGILDFWGMNLKSIQINHRHPATRTIQTSMHLKMIINGQANHAIASFAFSYRIYHLRTRSSLTIQSTRATILAYGQGVGLDVQLFLFNRGDCIVAGYIPFYTNEKPQFIEFEIPPTVARQLLGGFRYK